MASADHRFLSAPRLDARRAMQRHLDRFVGLDLCCRHRTHGRASAISSIEPLGTSSCSTSRPAPATSSRTASSATTATPARPRVSRHRRGHRLRHEDRVQAEGGRAAARGVRQAVVEGRARHVQRRHRLLPGGREGAGADAAVPRGLPRVSKSGLDHHEERARRTRRRSDRRARARSRRAASASASRGSNPELARTIEPWAASPQRRLKVIETFAKAGVPVGVMIAPIIPGLNDSQMVKVLEAARRTRARSGPAGRCCACRAS